MKGDFQVVEDHEEFARIVRDSETGVYVQELWSAHSNRRGKPVSSANVAMKAFKALYEREEWDRRLLLVNPGVSFSPLPQDAAAGRMRRRSNPMDLSGEGFWWATAPIDYWEEFDAPENHVFDVRTRDLDISLWAFEYTSRLTPEKIPPLPEFRYRWEAAIVDDAMFVYDESPEAPYASGAL